MIISIDTRKTFDKVSGEQLPVSFWDDTGDRGYHVDWQIDRLDLKGVKWKMSLHMVTMCSFTEVKSTSECVTAGGVAPIPGVTVMGDRVPLSLVMEVLPHFTSLHSSLDTNPSQNWSQMKLNQNPRHSANYSFPLFLWLLHFYFCPVLLRYIPGEGDGNPLQYSYWRHLWTEEPGRLWPIGSQRVRHHWDNLACTHAHTEV